MIRKEALRQLRDGYRSVAAQRYEKQLKATEEQLEQLRTAGQLAEEQYNARMDSLEADYEEKLSKLETYIDKFARIDLSDLDADEQKIISLVQAGDFDQALRIYESQNLSARLKQSRADQSKLTAARDQLAEAAHQKEIENERLRASIERQVTLLLMAGGEENLMKVLNIRREVFLADTTHCLSRRAYAAELFALGMPNEAILTLKNGISIANRLDQGFLSSNISDFLMNMGEYEESLSYTELADSLLWEIRDQDYKVQTRTIPLLTSNYIKLWGILTTDAAKCEQQISRIVEHQKIDSLDGASLLNYCDLFSCMTDYYSRNGQHKLALEYLDKSLNLGELLNQIKPWDSDLYVKYAEACEIYAFEGLSSKSTQSAHRMMELIDKKTQHGVGTMGLLDYATAYYTAATTLVSQDDYVSADSVCQQAARLLIKEKTHLHYPQIMDEILGGYQLAEGKVALHKGETARAERLLNEALDMIASTDNGATYIDHMRAATNALIYTAQKKYKEAEAAYLKAIDAAESNYKENPDAWNSDTVCRYFVELSDTYTAQGNKKAAIKALKNAKKYAAFEGNLQQISKRQNK